MKSPAGRRRWRLIHVNTQRGLPTLCFIRVGEVSFNPGTDGTAMTNRRMDAIIKDQRPLVLASKDTVQVACQQMWERRVGATLVTDDSGRLVGIFTGRDAVRALAEGKDPATTLLATAMTPEPDSIAPGSTAIDALRLMRDAGYRHLPIIEHGQILGIVSRGDFEGMELDRVEQEISIWERSA
jgi:CBS domain-containing protein